MNGFDDDGPVDYETENRNKDILRRNEDVRSAD